LRIFHTPLLFGAPGFRGEVKHQETRVMGLLCSEDCMILTSTVFDPPVWRTDGRRDRRTGDSI